MSLFLMFGADFHTAVTHNFAAKLQLRYYPHIIAGQHPLIHASEPKYFVRFHIHNFSTRKITQPLPPPDPV
ncbi:MAG: hypothetical protein K2M12_10590, partial [Muribaculaceae bacterium]|nr:hypothetical protein [Muribaculaceae bacterium]